MYRYLRSISYNGFLGLIYTINTKNKKYQKFSIFSYVNGTDSELINLDENTVFKLSNYIKEENIENNIFGVDLHGIKIIKLPNSNEIGVYYFSKLNKNIIILLMNYFINQKLKLEKLVILILLYLILQILIMVILVLRIVKYAKKMYV